MYKFTRITTVITTCLTLSVGYAYAEDIPHKVEVTERAHVEDIRPFDNERDAMADVDAALIRAQANGTRALIVMGANWCHDSRALATRLERSEFKTLITDQYELVYVSAGANPGQNNQNRDVSKRFGVEKIEGTPTVFITNDNGDVLNADSAGYWRRAESVPVDMTLAYFTHYSGK